MSQAVAMAHKINVFHQEWFLEASRFFVDFATAEEPLVAVGETEYAGAEVGPPGNPVQQGLEGEKARLKQPRLTFGASHILRIEYAKFGGGRLSS